MFLIKSQNYTPKQRWQVKIFFKNARLTNFKKKLFSFKTNHKLTLSGSKNIYGLRRKNKTLLIKVKINKIQLVPFIITNFFFKKQPFNQYAMVKNLFNQETLMLNSALCYPGFIYYPSIFVIREKQNFINQYVPLRIIPINMTISFIFNPKNNYITYAKSSGSNAIKRKHLKKTKLTYIQLPSQQLKLFPTATTALFSPRINLLLHKLIEGGWGSFTKNKKVINVRGVAKNPVDHPNGGRTKTCQPELSPWGWVAKKNK